MNLPTCPCSPVLADWIWLQNGRADGNREGGRIVSRLIDANALKKALRTDKGADAVGHSIVKLLKIDKIIDELPTVDAVEVVHGRWEKHWCDNSMIGHEFEECSECGCSMLDTNQFWDSNYCPNCGATMDGDENES